MGSKGQNRPFLTFFTKSNLKTKLLFKKEGRFYKKIAFHA